MCITLWRDSSFTHTNSLSILFFCWSAKSILESVVCVLAKWSWHCKCATCQMSMENEEEKKPTTAQHKYVLWNTFNQAPSSITLSISISFFSLVTLNWHLNSFVLWFQVDGSVIWNIKACVHALWRQITTVIRKIITIIMLYVAALIQRSSSRSQSDSKQMQSPRNIQFAASVTHQNLSCLCHRHLMPTQNAKLEIGAKSFQIFITRPSPRVQNTKTYKQMECN